MQAIQTHGLTKDYGGGRGVRDLDLEVHQGEVFGFLGPNGAGKTTTIRLLMDMIRPTRGTARILGLDSRSDSTAVKALVGYLPGELPDFGAMRAGEVVGLVAGLRRVPVDARVARLCERLDLDLSQRFRALSHGNKQKVGLVLAFMHEPRLLILDEPTSGLDPLIQQEFYGLVREARDAGATVFVSSHVLSEVEHICQRAAFIRDARLLQVVALDDVTALHSRRVDLEFTAAAPTDKLRGVPGVTDVQVEGQRLRCTVTGPIGALLEALAGTGVSNLTTHEPSLEETFLRLYRPPATP